MQRSRNTTGIKNMAAVAVKKRLFSHFVFVRGHKRGVEALWQDFFSNTSQWWDHRPEKINPSFPDFKHKQTRESLWLADSRNPPWVQAELAAIQPGVLQTSVFAWAQRLKRYAKAGQYEKTLEVFDQMLQERITPDTRAFLPVLNACAGLGALEEGKRIHTQIIKVGSESDLYVANCLVDMYVKCGGIDDAWSVFNQIQERNVVTWSAMIGGYVKSGYGMKAMELFWKMQQEGVEPDAIMFVGLLNACASVRALQEGINVHEQIIRSGSESNVHVATCLVDMYAKCGCIEDAWRVFTKMREQNVVAWSAMIGGYAKSGQGLKAIQLFRKMQQEGIEPDTITFIEVLNACASVMALEEGRRVHIKIVQRGCESDVYLRSCLINMYAKCGSVEDAWSLFNKMPKDNVGTWNAMIAGYVKCGKGLKALELFKKMQQEGVEPTVVTFIGVLNACASVAAFEEGRYVHEQIIQRGCEADISVGNSLIDMYTKCGSIGDAWSTFTKMQEHNVVTWNAIIIGYVKFGQFLKVMELSLKMQEEGVDPDAVTFVGLLSACATVGSLQDGRDVHEKVILRGLESEIYVGNCLVDMYAKCGSLEDAWSVFNRMSERNVVTWSTMIGGYVKSGQRLKAVELFRKMQEEGVEPDTVAFVAVLNACASLLALEEGRCVHGQIIQRGCESDVYVGSSLVDMYAKCGSMEDAWSVFLKMHKHDTVSWSTMIGGYAKSGQGVKALELFREMQEQMVEPDAVTFGGVLIACATVSALAEGRRIHSQIIKKGWESNVFVGNCLIDMYAKCGSIEEAWVVFNKIQENNVVSWNAMIGGYVMSGQALKAMELFQKMQKEGLEPNVVTFVGMLNACASVAALLEGTLVHEQIIQRGYQSDVFVATCLLDMYAKCGSIENAWSVFSQMQEHNVVTWNTMIRGYAKFGQGLKGMELFQKMQEEGVEPDTVTFVGVLNSCASVAALEEGRRVHEQIIRRGCESDVYVGGSLVDMYAKCGSIEDAWSVFNKMPEHNLVTWNAIIGGYVKSGQGQKALELLGQMQEEGVEPDGVSFVGVLNACSSVAALEEGKRFHEQIILSGWESDVCVGSCLVDMYAKCGSIEDARRVFKRMPMRNAVTWTAMIWGYAMHGHPKKAIELFERMRKEGVEINDVTITCLLSACNHGGLVKEGLGYFESISTCFNMFPTKEHYSCMVDLLGRAGQLEEAEELAKMMPFKPDLCVWMSLLGACRIHGNTEIAERAAKECLALDPENISSHVLLSNIYACGERARLGLG